jgi:hypothetical protein
MATKENQMSMPKTSSNMGHWKTNTYPFKWRDGRPANKAPSRTAAKLARIRIALPPAGGWPGGDPSKNGHRASSK